MHPLKRGIKMINIKKDSLNFDTLIPILIDGNEGSIYRDDKYCYKIIYPEFRNKSKEIIRLVNDERIKDLIEIVGTIEEKGEYVGFITPYLRGYIKVLPAAKSLSLKNRIKLIKRIGIFGKQFEYQFYRYDDFGVDNIMIKPTKDLTNYSDMIFLDPEAIEVIDDQGIDGYSNPLFNEFMSLDCGDISNFNLPGAFKNASEANAQDFDNTGLYYEDFNSYDITLEDEDGLMNGEIKDMKTFYRAIAIVSLSILTKYDWETELSNKKSHIVLDKIKKKYKDPKLDQFLNEIFFNHGCLDEMYFHEYMGDFDLEKLGNTK